MTRQQKYPDSFVYHYHNANPKGRITADCVIRAISTALNQDYNETLNELCQLQMETGYMLNDKKCYEKYLDMKGWIKCKQPRKIDGTKYTGHEFCSSGIIKKLQLGKRIVAHIGGHHLVAIIDGRVWDTWNSTGGCIGNYWIKK